MYRSKSGVEGSFLKEKTFLKGRFVSLIYTFFAHGYDELRMRRDLLGHFDSFAYEFLGSNNFTYKTLNKNKTTKTKNANYYSNIFITKFLSFLGRDG